MVPVIRQADKTSLADLTSQYTELVDLARRRRVTSEMTAGGIASVSNFGTFGLDWGTPIPLPDQTLLLGLGAGKKAPTWDEAKKQFVPTTQAELTLSFDHRSLDGGGAGRLLQRVMELLERPTSCSAAQARVAHARRVRSPGAAASVLRKSAPPLPCCADEFNRGDRPQSHDARAAGAVSRCPTRALSQVSHRWLRSCGFSPDETLAGVCARNDNLDPDEVIEHILASDAADRAMQIEPRELADVWLPARAFIFSMSALARSSKR